MDEKLRLFWDLGPMIYFTKWPKELVKSSLIAEEGVVSQYAHGDWVMGIGDFSLGEDSSA